jgi:hypothetical protein
MTEAEWLAATSPGEMLRYVDADAGGRQAYLFSAACLRRIWHLLPGPKSQSVAVALERRADGIGDWAAVEEAREAAKEEGHAFETSERRHPRARRHSSVYAARAAAEWSPVFIAEIAAEAIASAHEGTADAISTPEERVQSVILRDIFGNPFRPVVFSPEWRTDTAILLARGMYESRDFSAMPILADALQDTGCDHAEILSHCRGPGPHVRGCCVVDLVLGKE